MSSLVTSKRFDSGTILEPFIDTVSALLIWDGLKTAMLTANRSKFVKASYPFSCNQRWNGVDSMELQSPRSSTPLGNPAATAASTSSGFR